MKNSSRPVIFGEVLFDRFPNGKEVLGGAPFNVAWNLQALGESPVFLSRVGEDSLGRKIREAMLDWGMDTAGLQADPQHPTGTVEVTIRNGEPSFEIKPGSAWDFIEPETFKAADRVGLLYHGTLALRSSTSAWALERFRALLDVPVFIDVNLRDPWWDQHSVLRLVSSGRWLKLNQHEVKELLTGEGRSGEQFLRSSSMELVVVTEGKDGATLFRRGKKSKSVKPSRRVPVVDSVGAGDAFSSVLILGLLRGWRLALSLERAQQFAEAILGIEGATCTDRSFYQPFIEKWGLT